MGAELSLSQPSCDKLWQSGGSCGLCPWLECVGGPSSLCPAAMCGSHGNSRLAVGGRFPQLAKILYKVSKDAVLLHRRVWVCNGRKSWSARWDLSESGSEDHEVWVTTDETNSSGCGQLPQDLCSMRLVMESVCPDCSCPRVRRPSRALATERKLPWCALHACTIQSYSQGSSIVIFTISLFLSLSVCHLVDLMTPK